MNKFKKSLLNISFIYKIWFYTYLNQKNKNLRLPKNKDPLYFDGYPRSGNTYTFGLIYRVYPSLHCKVSHHLHSIIVLKIAIKKDIKSIVIIRNPKDAIISYLYANR